MYVCNTPLLEYVGSAITIIKDLATQFHCFGVLSLRFYRACPSVEMIERNVKTLSYKLCLKDMSIQLSGL